MKVYIKNMVCDRCIMVIRNVLDEMDFHPDAVMLGEVDFGNTMLDNEQLQTIQERISPLGFELISDRKQRLIEGIKTAIIELVQAENANLDLRLSDYLSGRFHHEYSYLSSLFSSVQGISIEQYLINQKIEKVKELLVYDELNLTQIADQLGYSSTAHLSSQFKKVTGLTPTNFKSLKDARQRKSLDSL